ncbi:right-handed parallel beta-helix repeat-containing protein [Aquifex pyrophilus]
MEGKIKSLVLLLLIPFLLFGKEILVCERCKVKSIKRAISMARNGDTIKVKGGVYREGTVILNKSVKLIGINFPVIDGEKKHEVVKIVANDVEIRGFEIINSGVSELEDIAGIKVEGAKRCVIRNNRLINNFWAVYLANVSECIVEGNYIKGPFRVGEVASGNGIHAWHSSRILIRDNYITGHRDGIYFEFVKDSLIEGNISEGNWRYGLHFMFSHRDVYRKNTFRRNGAGVAVMYSKRIKMLENRFEFNWGESSYGLLLKAIDDSLIERNIFFKNTAGIYMDECQRSVIRMNDFMENGWAMRVWANSFNNLITKNNFFSNTFYLSTNGKNFQNKLEENYWSAYKGFDLNGDGYGDIPFKPISFFSYVVENNPVASLLLRSTFVKILDLIEQTFPALFFINVQDSKPLMEPVRWRK